MGSISMVLRLAIGAALIALGIWVGSAGVPTLWNSAEMDRGIEASYARMVPVTGRVLTRRWAPVGGKPFGHLYLTFEYVIQNGSPLEDKVDETVKSSESDRYPVGGPIELYYDPQSPKFVRTARAYEQQKGLPPQHAARWIGLGFTGFGLIAVLIGTALGWPGVRSVRRKARR